MSLATTRRDLEQFFGVPRFQISSLSLEIARAHPCPDWIRSRPKITLYPRFWPRDFPHRVDLAETFLGIAEMAEQVVFVVDHLDGRWSCSFNGFSFENPTDAVHFRLRF